MRKWFQGHRGRSLLAGTVAAITLGGLAYAAVGPLDAFGSSATTTGAATTASAGSATGGTTAGAIGTAGLTFVAKGGALGTALQGRRGWIRRLLRRSVHASLVVKDGTSGYITVDIDRGAIKAVSTTSISIVRPDGVTVTDSVSSSTEFVRTTEASLKPGTRVVMIGAGGSARYVIGLRKVVAAPPSTA
jgi:hypothetical protein